MRFHYSSLIFILILASCKPYSNITKDSNQITYSEFRLEQNTFASKDGNIKYIDKGQGDVILLLHGIPTSGWLYRNMIDDLSKNYRVIAPDMLGFGSSDSPKGYDIYSETQHAERLINLMNHLNIENWTHVMHDSGGIWTWELFKTQPNRISNLIILNSIIYKNGFNPPVRFKPGFIAKTAMWSYRNSITTNMMLKKLFKKGLTNNTLNKIDIEGYKKPLTEGKTKGMYYFFSQTCNDLTNYQPIIENINIPVTVIWGENDSFLKWTPQKDAIIKDLKISKDNIHLLNAKHFIQEEQPEKINALILDFIEH